jgi:prefoldin subunit 5
MAKAPGSKLERAELSRLGAEVRSLKAQIAALRARVTDLEKWERQVAAVSVRKHSGKRVRKHMPAYPKIRKH